MKPSLYEQLALDRENAHQAGLKAEQRKRELARLRYEHAGLRLDLVVLKLRRAFELKYSPDQPRVPAGQTDGGQWTDGREGQAPRRIPVSDIGPKAPDRARIILAGGIKPEDHGLLVEQFASRYCRGFILREIPGQFKHSTVGEMLAAKEAGDRAAGRCYKLLNDNRFRK